jgi:hypothetical protein
MLAGGRLAFNQGWSLMFARSSASISLAAGFVFLGLATFGCKSQPAAESQLSTPRAIPLSGTAAAQPKVTLPAAPTVQPQPAEPDDASLLARKTSEYANDMSHVLAQHPTGPAPRASIVQWIDPAQHPVDSSTNVQPATPSAANQQPIANQPVSLAAAHFKEDSSVPLILPESADQIAANPTTPASPTESAGAPVTASTDEYEIKLLKLVQDYPRDLGNQLDYQLLRLVRDEPTPDLSEVSQLSSEDRDLLLALMDGLTNFRAAARRDGNLMLNRKIQPLIEMADRLRSQGQLSIPTVAFCTKVSSFGVYDPMASSRFLAGRENDMIIYCEAANFTSVRGNDTIWRTRFRQELVLYTDTGIAVWPDKSNSASFVDQSRDRRHDFFIPRLVRLPSSLAVGKYLLKITLTDEESNRVVEASAPMEIVSGSESTDAQPAADRAASPASPFSP